MKRTITLFLVLAVMFCVVLPCGAWAAEESSAEVIWRSYHYTDQNGDAIEEMVMVNDPMIEGVYTTAQNERYRVYLEMWIDATDVGLFISGDGETYLTSNETYDLTVNIYTDSSLNLTYAGIVEKGGVVFNVDPDARTFIAQDMRMASGVTGIEIVNNATGELFQFILPHDGNFRDQYDAQEEQGWRRELTASDKSGVTPEFKEKIDAYFTYFHDLAADMESDGVQGGVGALDAIMIGVQAWGNYQDFKQLGESATTQADKDYYESVRAEVWVYLTTGALGAYVNSKG